MFILWLDDERDPALFLPPTNCEVVWVKTYREFAEVLSLRGHEVGAVHFDHDLGEGEGNLIETGFGPRWASGKDCADFLLKRVVEGHITRPIALFCHSMNPVGRHNIEAVLKEIRQLVR